MRARHARGHITLVDPFRRPLRPRCLALVVVACCSALPLITCASPQDPIWVPGVYDVADYDDVSRLIDDLTGLELRPPVADSPPLVASHHSRGRRIDLPPLAPRLRPPAAIPSGRHRSRLTYPGTFTRTRHASVGRCTGRSVQ